MGRPRVELLLKRKSAGAAPAIKTLVRYPAEGGGDMSRLTLSILALFICVIELACSSSTNSKNSAKSADPFVGFFAHPSSGMLELKPADGKGKYRGSMWADFGPFPVELTRDGNIARGTVAYGGASHPLQVESTPQGLVLTAEGTRAEAPLQRYDDMKAYEKWFAAQGGYQATIKVTTQPSR
jgi:hypothetical protein